MSSPRGPPPLRCAADLGLCTGTAAAR